MIFFSKIPPVTNFSTTTIYDKIESMGIENANGRWSNVGCAQARNVNNKQRDEINYEDE